MRYPRISQAGILSRLGDCWRLPFVGLPEALQDSSLVARRYLYSTLREPFRVQVQQGTKQINLRRDMCAVSGFIKLN